MIAHLRFRDGCVRRRVYRVLALREDREALMTNRRHNRILLGVGALLGLCAGCQNGFVAARPNSLFSAVAARRTSGPAAETQHPWVIASSTRVVNAAPTAAVTPAVVMEAPIIRASAEEMPGEPVVASSWHAMPRPTDSEGPGLTDTNPQTQPANVSKVLSPLDSPMPAVGPEALQTPRRLESGMHGEIVSSPHGTSSTLVRQGHPGSTVHGHHGILHDSAVPREGHKSAMPAYVIEPPDVLSVQLLRDAKRVPQPIDGQFLVRPDGSITIGVYGTVHVAGLTIDDAKKAIADKLSLKLKAYTVENDEGKKVPISVEDEIVVDVLEYASKYCYVIADGGGSGAQVVRIPINGSDTVLDTLGKIGGLPPQAALKKIWLARPATHQLLPIDWKGISQRAEVATNYQVFHGDRIFVQSDPRIRFQSNVLKTIAPFETITGGVLLGASAKNALKGTSTNNNR